MEKSTTIGSWLDMQQFGIGCLTGESCPYNMRVLCDVNSEGRDLLRSFFGLCNNPNFGPPWNSQVNGKSSRGSILLTREMLFPITAFAMFQKLGYKYVYQFDGTGIICGTNERKHHLVGAKCYCNTSTHPQVDGRNVHQMSGRTV